MRRLSTRMLALVCLSLLAPAAWSDSPSETVRAFHQSMERGDREGALRLLLPELLVYEGGHVEATRDEYAREHLGADIKFSRQADRQVISMNEQLFGDRAIVTGTFVADWQGTRLAGTETVVLSRANGAWRIAHIHWSSHRVAVDD